MHIALKFIFLEDMSEFMFPLDKKPSRDRMQNPESSAQDPVQYLPLFQLYLVLFPLGHSAFQQDQPTKSSLCMLQVTMLIFARLAPRTLPST